MAALPAVRGLQEELAASGIDGLLINIHDETGQAVLSRFDFQFSPTFLVFDSEGEEVLRSNTPPSLAGIQAALAPPEN